MPYRSILSVFSAATLLSAAACAQPASTAPPPDAPTTAAPADDPVFADTVWLDNGTVRLGVSPSVGRITWFGFSGGDNLIWVNPDTVNTPPDHDPDTWVNYGGDKTWIGPQNAWKFFLPHGSDFPPDGTLDGEAWKITEHTEHSLAIQSQRSQVFDVLIRRRITLPAPGQGRGVSIRSEIICDEGGSPMPMQAWNITQIKVPDAVALGVSAVPGGPGQGVLMFDGEKFEGELEERDGFTLWTPRDQPTGKKIGTISRWVAADLGGIVFIQTAPFDEHGIYPENSNTQLWVADDYVELEKLSPAVQVRPGVKLVYDVTWTLVKLDPEKGTNWENLTTELAKLRP